MNYSRVIDGQLAYYFKERYNIYELFHTRYSLYKRAYNHSVCKAIDFMICDALIEADNAVNAENADNADKVEAFKISDSIHDTDKFLKLDDTILNQIEYSSKQGLEKSKEIIKRIRTRDLYKLVDEFSVSSDEKEFAKFLKNEITEKNIIESKGGLETGDVIVEIPRLDYGKREEDPVESVKFYDKNNKIKDEKEIPEASYLIPKKYEEFIFRVYTRDRKKIDDVKKGFQTLLEKVKEKFKNSSHM